ncbi:hypothetical protein [Flavobacterium faecale]|nr:hypothetical protein [Flavobacterium faecale]
MKYHAHLENNLNSEIVSIFDVKNGLNSKFPKIWENREYYSLSHFTPMKAVVNTKSKTPHFAFKNGGGGNENSGTGESIEHQLSKEIIYDKKSLKLKIGEIQDTLMFSEIFIEKPFENGLFRTDLYAKIKENNKFELPVDSFLIIEIHKTNKVTKTKQQFFRDNNYAAIEIDLYKEIKFDNDLNKLYRQLSGYFDKERYARTLHNPNYIKQKIERERKVEEKRLLQLKNESSKQSKIEIKNEPVIIVRKVETAKVQSQEENFNATQIEEKKNIFARILNFILRK